MSWVMFLSPCCELSSIPVSIFFAFVGMNKPSGLFWCRWFIYASFVLTDGVWQNARKVDKKLIHSDTYRSVTYEKQEACLNDVAYKNVRRPNGAMQLALFAIISFDDLWRVNCRPQTNLGLFSFLILLEFHLNSKISFGLCKEISSQSWLCHPLLCYFRTGVNYQDTLHGWRLTIWEQTAAKYQTSDAWILNRVYVVLGEFLAPIGKCRIFISNAFWLGCSSNHL